MRVSKGTIIRTAVFILATINTGLVLFDKSPLPIDDVMIEQVVSFIFNTAAGLTVWWKNNSFTPAAIWADKQIKKFKEEV